MRFADLEQYTFSELEELKWSDMELLFAVFDRTQSDIDNRTSKGFLNLEDWNRIAQNIVILGESIPCPVTDTTISDMETIPKSTGYNSFSVVDDNIRSIRESYPTQQSDYLGYFLEFDGMNKREQFIFETYRIWYVNEQAKPYCGEIYCGEIGLI